MISLYENGVNGILADEMVSSNLLEFLWQFLSKIQHLSAYCISCMCSSMLHSTTV